MADDCRDPSLSSSVIFLDIDGVLNRTREAKLVCFEEDLIARFKSLLKSVPAASIVLSTFWRPFLPYVAYVLHRHGIDARRIVGRTPGCSPAIRSCPFLSVETSILNDADEPSRAHEIRKWLVDHPHVRQFVIIDDRESAADEGLLSHFVHTDTRLGLTDRDVAKAIAILTEG